MQKAASLNPICPNPIPFSTRSPPNLFRPLFPNNRQQNADRKQNHKPREGRKLRFATRHLGASLQLGPQTACHLSAEVPRVLCSELLECARVWVQKATGKEPNRLRNRPERVAKRAARVGQKSASRRDTFPCSSLSPSSSHCVGPPPSTAAGPRHCHRSCNLGPKSERISARLSSFA